MAFSMRRRAASISPGFGSPLKNDTMYTNSVSLSGTTGTTTVPSTGVFAPTISRGWIRIKIFGGGGTSPTVVVTSITGTDGTSTETYYTNVTAASLSATVAGTATIILMPFESDLDLTSITVNTTLAGTSPTATMDIDIAATSN